MNSLHEERERIRQEDDDYIKSVELLQQHTHNDQSITDSDDEIMSQPSGSVGEQLTHKQGYVFMKM